MAAMRRARNQLLAEVPLFAVAADLYDHCLAAASLIRRSDTARTLVRRLIGPIGAAALAQREP